MKIYTYCSYRSSRYGYQYSRFTSGTSGNVTSLLASESEGKIPAMFRNWCENRSNWQLVLKKSQNTGYYWLIAGQLEKSRRLEKIRRRRLEEVFDENSLDSDFYMTLGFFGTLEEIKPMALYFLKCYRENGFQTIFNGLEKTIRKTENSERYVIDAQQFHLLFSGLKPPAKSKNPSPSKYLSAVEARRQGKKLSERRKYLLNCENLLSGMEDFSGKLLLLIAYADFETKETANIRIDYEYLWGQV